MGGRPAARGVRSGAPHGSDIAADVSEVDASLKHWALLDCSHTLPANGAGHAAGHWRGCLLPGGCAWVRYTPPWLAGGGFLMWVEQLLTQQGWGARCSRSSTCR